MVPNITNIVLTTNKEWVRHLKDFIWPRRISTNHEQRLTDNDRHLWKNPLSLRHCMQHPVVLLHARAVGWNFGYFYNWPVHSQTCPYAFKQLSSHTTIRWSVCGGRWGIWLSPLCDNPFPAPAFLLDGVLVDMANMNSRCVFSSFDFTHWLTISFHSRTRITISAPFEWERQKMTWAQLLHYTTLHCPTHPTQLSINELLLTNLYHAANKQLSTICYQAVSKPMSSCQQTNVKLSTNCYQAVNKPLSSSQQTNAKLSTNQCQSINKAVSSCEKHRH